MGIQGLLPWLEKNHPRVFHNVHLSHFAYKKICFDISSYLYKYMSTYGKDNNRWLNAFVHLICFFRQHAVNVTFIFDGKAPSEKNEEKADRGKQRDKSDENCFNLKLAINRFKECGEKLPILVETMRTLSIKKYNEETRTKIKRLLKPSKKEAEDPSKLDDGEIPIDIKMIEEYYQKKEQNNFEITPEDTESLKGLFDKFKIPWMKAPHEAETLANDMVKRDLAYATFSLDSDCIAYKTPVIINNLDMVSGICRVVYFDKLCQELELEPDQVTLFCIMCGTDYNRHVKNLERVGPVNAYKLVKKYKTLKAMIDDDALKLKDEKVEDTGLRHDECVKIFNSVYPDVTTVGIWDLRVDLDEIETFLRLKSLSCDKDKFKRLWSPPKIVFDDNENENENDNCEDNINDSSKPEATETTDKKTGKF